MNFDNQLIDYVSNSKNGHRSIIYGYYFMIPLYSIDAQHKSVTKIRDDVYWIDIVLLQKIRFRI